MYLSATVFRFCLYHKMFLHYILVTDIINIIDYYVGIPIEDLELLMIHGTITGLFLFVILYLYVKRKLPRGKHEIGFKELSWSKKELDEFVKKCRTTQGLCSNPNSRIA